MKQRTLCLIAAVVLAAVATGKAANAYDDYSGCEPCHGEFWATPYISLTDGAPFPGGLHGLHRLTMLNYDCNTCHSGGGRSPVYLNSSAGGTGFPPIGCIGCHGRAEDRADPGPPPVGDGAGLRQHHYNAGIVECAGCHTDADPLAYTPVGENVAPPYYFTPDPNHPGKPTDPCNFAGDEDVNGGSLGLDNDGDLAYDGDDPDCGAPPTTTTTTLVSTTTTVTVTTTTTSVTTSTVTTTTLPGGCTSDQDCDDGNYCNGDETCDAGTGECQPGTPRDCSGYVGSDACKLCHEAKWNDFRVSGHPHKLKPAAQAAALPLPLPEGYDWSEIAYVIGGYKWKARYIDTSGYIITDNKTTGGKTQYNLATGEWVDYHAGQVHEYDCGRCHTTGYDPAGHQDGLPGIVGTWVFPGIQCEQCHGPGGPHVADPTGVEMIVDPSAAACGNCHVRSDPATIPAAGGFIRHHEQYNEFLASPHSMLSCTSCHDPHKKAEFSITTECVDCHTDKAELKVFKGLGKKHLRAGIECKDCHMPYAAKSAVAYNKYKGDVRSHLFRITTDPAADLFNADGTLANDALPGEWVCLGCHTAVTDKFDAKGKPEKAIAWARKKTRSIHK